MEQVHKDRLLRLAHRLEEDADNKKGVKFNLDVWADGEPKLDCGTQACAVGLAMLSPEFQAQGFTHEKDGVNIMVPVYMSPDGGYYTSWGAVEAFFGLHSSDYHFLFSSMFYPKAKRKGRKAELEVASRIRKFVEDPTFADGKRKQYSM